MTSSLRFMGNLTKTVYYIARYLVRGIWQRHFCRHSPQELRGLELENTARNARDVLAALNVQIKVKLPRPDLFSRSYFMVCNHMSYLDILVLSTIQKSVFVTSVEMEKTFFLGDLAKLGGSFFVDRINRRKMKEEVSGLKEILGQGFNLFIFPEGTSTNGLEVLPFKKSLFRVAKETHSPLLPICLRYLSVNGQPYSKENCDQIAWYGDMAFFPHFLSLMTLQELQVEVEYLEPLNPDDYADHGELALAAEKRIRSAYQGAAAKQSL